MNLLEVIAKLEKERRNTRFLQLIRICEESFGRSRVKGSHHIFKTPWTGDPRLNIQADKGKAKPYQVDQVRAALKKLTQIGEKGEGDN